MAAGAPFPMTCFTHNEAGSQRNALLPAALFPDEAAFDVVERLNGSPVPPLSVVKIHCKNEQHERQQGHGRKKHFG
jgi:hypothetical protein